MKHRAPGVLGVGTPKVTLVQSKGLPIPPSPGENARRAVRHAYGAAYMDWLGLPLGPLPGRATHLLSYSDDVVLISAEALAALRDDVELSAEVLWGRSAHGAEGIA